MIREVNDSRSSSSGSVIEANLEDEEEEDDDGKDEANETDCNFLEVPRADDGLLLEDVRVLVARLPGSAARRVLANAEAGRQSRCSKAHASSIAVWSKETI